MISDAHRTTTRPAPTTRFTERMVGPVTLLPDAGAGLARVALQARDEVVGDDIVELARRSVDSATVLDLAGAFRRRTLDLTALDLAVEPAVSGRDGFRAAVVGGWITGLRSTLDGPVVAGFADLLHSTAAGERRMYYRLVSGGAQGDGRDGWAVVEGVKVVDGPVFAAWRQTTTLYTRASRLADDPRARAWLAAIDRPIDEAEAISAGVLRIRTGDLVRQVASMRGGVPRFLRGFARRLVTER